MSTTKNEQAVAKTDEKFMEFVPFGAEDKIKLSVSIIQNLVAVKTRSGKTCTPNDAVKFMMLCQARRLNPFEGDCFLIGYDGKEGPTFSLITAHQAFLKRAEMNPEYDGMKSGIIVTEGDRMVDLEGDFYIEGQQQVVGGWATVYFKNRKQPMHKRVRLKRFQKSFGVWQDDAAGMICKCAEADALRSSFPTMLGGLYLKEEVETRTPAQTSTPIFQSATTVDSTVVSDPGVDEITKVKNLCKDSGIEEAKLVAFIKEIVLTEDSKAATLEDVAKENDTALGMVVDQWEDFSRRIKEVAK